MYNKMNFNFFAINDEDYGMRRNALWSTVTGLLLFVGIAAVSKADFQYSVVMPGGGPTGVLPVSASTPIQIFLNSTNAAQIVGAAGIRIQIAGGGAGVPQIVTTPGGVTPGFLNAANGYNGTLLFNSPNSSQLIYDLGNINTVNPFPIGFVGNQLVATVNVNTLGFAGQGPFTFSFTNSQGASFVSAPGVVFHPTTAVGGSFTVVPEPSSIALIGLVGVGVVAARRFRKKSKA